MPLKGNYAELSKLTRKIQGMADPKFRIAVSKTLAQAARTEIDIGFEKARDPYGKAWPRSSGEVTMRKTGRLMNSVRSSSNTRGFKYETPVKYAAVQQYGATIRARVGGGRRDTRGRYQRPGTGLMKFRIGGQWISKRQVTIPARPFMPEGKIGPIWMKSFDKTMSLFLLKWKAA